MCRASSSACAQAVGLAEKRDCCAAALSGGMKRKLQVALALLGDSRVVLLGGAPTLTTTLGLLACCGYMMSSLAVLSLGIRQQLFHLTAGLLGSHVQDSQTSRTYNPNL